MPILHALVEDRRTNVLRRQENYLQTLKTLPLHTEWKLPYAGRLLRGIIIILGKGKKLFLRAHFSHTGIYKTQASPRLLRLVWNSYKKWIWQLLGQ